MVEWKKLGEVCSRITDGSHSSPTAVEKGYYMPSVKDMTNNGFNFSSCKIISEEDYNNLVKTGCKPEIGDVLISKDGSMLKYVFPVLKDYDIVLLSSIAILTPIQKYVNSKYLSHYLRGDDIKEKTIREFSSKGGVPRIILKNFKKILIPIPSLSEQNRIVGILDTFTDSIENLKQQIAQRRKQYEFYRDQLLDLEGKEGVEMKTLGWLCKVGDGLHGTPVYNEDGDYYFVNGNNLSKGKIVIKNDTKKVDDSMFAKYGMNFDDNTIFMSINGTIGNVAIYDGERILLGKSAAYFTIKENNYLSYKFLYYILQTQSSFEYYYNKLTGSTIKNLGLKALREFPISLPSMEEQSRIVSILDTFEASISNLEAQLAQRQKQYEYYRNKLLTFE